VTIASDSQEDDAKERLAFLERIVLNVNEAPWGTHAVSFEVFFTRMQSSCLGFGLTSA